MTRPRLLAIDLDGTLLRTDGTVSARSRRALSQARTAGVIVLLATARPPRDVLPLHGVLDLLGPAVCISGAFVYDFARGETLRHAPLAAEIATRSVERGREALPGIAFAAEVGWRYFHEPNYTASHSRPDDAVCADAASWVDQPVTKLLARHPDAGSGEIAAVLEEILGEEALVEHLDASFSAVVARDATKPAAVSLVCERAGIAPDEVVAFGDMPIDIPMFEWAGMSVAMANAAPSVLEAAQRVTTSNDEDGVALVVEALLG